MAISVIRKATNEDFAAVEKAAIRFCKRNDIKTGELAAADCIRHEIESGLYSHDNKLAQAWQRVFCRALGEKYDSRLTIAHDNVGYSI